MIDRSSGYDFQTGRYTELVRGLSERVLHVFDISILLSGTPFSGLGVLPFRERDTNVESYSPKLAQRYLPSTNNIDRFSSSENQGQCYQTMILAGRGYAQSVIKREIRSRVVSWTYCITNTVR